MGRRLGQDIRLEAAEPAPVGRPLLLIERGDLSYTSLAFGRRLARRRSRRVDGLHRRLLRQRGGRELLRHPRVRAPGPSQLADPSRLSSAVFDFTEAFYNRRRRHSTLDYLSPAGYEANARPPGAVGLADPSTEPG